MNLNSSNPVPPPIVLFVRPQAEGNIGALSRVMANFGCHTLRLIGQGPAKPLDPNNDFSKMDWAMAKGGQRVLESAQWFPDLKSATSDLNLVIGTSGKNDQIDHSYCRPLISPQEAFQLSKKWLLDTPPPNLFKWGLVMGPEHDGLDSIEQSFCHSLIHINTQPDCPSMNIAVAAACLLYHFSLYQADRHNLAPASREAFPKEHMADSLLASVGEKNTLVDYVIDTLKLTSFFKYPDDAAVSARVRRVLQSVNIPRGELLFLFEIFYQLKCWGLKKFEERNFLSPTKKQNP